MKNKKRGYVSIYTRYIKERPSCYYRIGQYINRISELRFVIHDGYDPVVNRLNDWSMGRWIQPVVYVLTYASVMVRRWIAVVGDLVGQPDVIVVQRESMPRYMPRLLSIVWKRLLERTEVIWDFDDHIFQNEISVSEKRILEECSDHIIVISEYLKRLVDKKYRKKVVLLPTTDDILDGKSIDYFIQKRKKSFEKQVKLVWVGTASNLKNLKMIMPEIEKAAKILRLSYGKSLVFYIVCNKPYMYETNEFPIVNIRWSREVAKKAICHSHIGIMPLEDNEYNRGKGGFKMIQYLSAGLPVIGSDVGYNSQVLDDDCGRLVLNNTPWEWCEAIVDIGSDWEEWKMQSLKSYDRYTDKFDLRKNQIFWEDVLHVKK